MSAVALSALVNLLMAMLRPSTVPTKPSTGMAPDHGVNHGITGGDLIFVVFALRLEDGGDVAHAADVVQIGERAINAVEQNEIAGVIDQAAHPFEHSLGRRFIENEVAVLRDGGQVQGPALQPQFWDFDQRNDYAPKKTERGGARGVEVAGPDKNGAQSLQTGIAFVQPLHQPEKQDGNDQREKESKRLIDTGEAPTPKQPPAIFDVFLFPAQRNGRWGCDRRGHAPLRRRLSREGAWWPTGAVASG